MKRECRYLPLSKQPLVLALCQVKFSPVRQMAEYISKIQDEFRRQGFPIERTITATPGIVISAVGMQVNAMERWEFRNRDETTSIVVTHESVVLLTTRYDRFENFAATLKRAVDTVLKITEQSEFGVIERIGLRYVDVVEPRPGEDFRTYLRPGFHGPSDGLFRPATSHVFVRVVGRTEVKRAGQPFTEGTLAVRVLQNNLGMDLPPDLVDQTPRRSRTIEPGTLVTLIDMDHFIEGSFDPRTDEIIALAYGLHDQVIEAFHEHIVTPEAIEVWR